MAFDSELIRMGEALRPCLAWRKDGEPCRAWATWESEEQFYALHSHPTRRKRVEMTEAIRRAQNRRRAPVCDCHAYAWPHRQGAGLCRYPDQPANRFPTPAGQRATASKRKSRRALALLRQMGHSFPSIGSILGNHS